MRKRSAIRGVRTTVRRKKPVVEKPRPDSDWGWAVEDRLGRLEDAQKWTQRLIVSGIAVGVIEAIMRGVR